MTRLGAAVRAMGHTQRMSRNGARSHLEDFVVISGLSGAGKSSAMNVFEDAGYFCVDNLPAEMIRSLAELFRHPGSKVERAAVVSDSRGGEYLSALAGVIDASTVSSGGNDDGAGLILTSIAAVALGGTSIFGGIGAVWKTVLGVLLLAMIANGFDLLSIASYYQDIFQGLVIIVAVAINSLATKR